jgi:hypothetical protein
MPFDPDAYLASKSAPFDPDAYLAEKGVIPRERLQAGLERNQKKVAALQAQPDPMSLGSIAKEVPGTMGALADRFMNAVTLGGFGAVRRKVAPEAAAAQEADTEQRLSSVPGQIAGGFMGATGAGVGAPRVIAERIAAPLTQAVTNPLLRAAAASGLTGGLSSGTQRGVEGGDIRQTTEAAGEGAAVGAAFGAGMAGLERGGRAILNSAGGRARALIERYGGRVGPTNSGSGGAFDDELAGLPANDRGIGEAAQRSGRRVMETTDRLHQERVAQPYQAEKAAIDAGPGQRPVDVDDVHQALMQVYQSPRLTTGQRGAIRSEIDSLNQRFLRPQLGVRVMTEQQLNDYKTMLNNLSRAGQAGTHTIPEAELGHVARLVRNKVNQGPYRDLNARYAEGAEERSDVRAALGLGPKESRNEAADATRVRNVIMRQTQDTVTGGATTMDLPQLRQRYPELQRDLDLPELLAAKSDLQFRAGGNGHGGLINRLPPGLGLGASAAMAMSHQGPVSLVPLAAEFAARNSGPIAGRLAYRPAQAAEGIGAAGQNPLIQAAGVDRLRQSDLAKRLRAYLSGGRR